MDFFSTLLSSGSQIASFLLALLGFLSLITVHEFGHFLFCKLFGVRTPTFSIGMGPIIAQKKIGDTNFCLSILPFGGFVEIGGFEEIGQGDQVYANDTSEQSFAVKPYWQKMLIWLGGIIFNLLFAFSIYLGLFVHGMPQPTIKSITITLITPESPAQRAGLKVGDEITHIGDLALINNEKPASSQMFFEKIHNSVGTPLSLTIKRNGKTKVKTVIPEQDTNISRPHGRIKAGFSIQRDYSTEESFGLIESVQKSISLIKEQFNSLLAGIASMFRERNLAGAGGPVMILSESFKMAQVGIKILLTFLGLINVSLAAMNLLPLGIVDGGQLLFVTIETILHQLLGSNVKKLSEKIRFGINVVSLIAFGFLFVYLTYKDITRLFGF